MEKALHDVKILDLSRVLAGPLGSMLLGDLGADVIRVEAPGGTDDIRSWWPFAEEESTYYLCANRNKRSVTINLKEEKGTEIFKKLVRNADVVVENFKTGTLDRLGIGYEALKEIKEDIILCSVTGYGQTGPYKNHPGYDPVIQAAGGLMDITGHPDGEPTRVGTPVVDIMTSHYVAVSILSALRVRDMQGVGQHIDLSLLDVQVASLANIASSFLINGHVSERIGNAHGNITPYETFQCRDKPIMVAAGNDRLFTKLCNALNHPEWSTDDRFKTNPARLENRSVLTENLDNIFKTDDADRWANLLAEYGIPCGPVNNIEQVFEHPQVNAREMVEEYEHPSLGKVRSVRNPIRFSESSTAIAKPPPRLGEHTETIFQEELGLSLEEINSLKAEGII
ncbi:CoA transferase [Evansella sp. LMS18]|uniref:CaiB/BaiF CoA transferase family protein n=1 Tax=Evansella sp. LMS18 TaxID=2924033 RepID=UPI0020D15879|nr:CoA transferase [Evansella sp. LMS18]UTR11911.1 CoA transferase [Evansella sp. LMS18]